MAGHQSLGDLFDSIEAISWCIAGIRRCPVFPDPRAAPPRSRLHELAESFGAKVNLNKNADFAKMLAAVEPDASHMLITDDHIVHEAYNEILNTLSSMRSRMSYRELSFARVEGKNTVNAYGMYLNPMFRTIFEQARDYVVGRLDAHDEFVIFLQEILPDGKSDVNEYDAFVDAIARHHSDVDLSELIESIADSVDIRGNLMPIAPDEVPTVETTFGRHQILNPEDGNSFVVREVLEEALAYTLVSSQPTVPSTRAQLGDDLTAWRKAINEKRLCVFHNKLGILVKKRGHHFFVEFGNSLEMLLSPEEIKALELTTQTIHDLAVPQTVAVTATMQSPEAREKWSWNTLASKIWQLASDAIRGGPAMQSSSVQFITNYVEIKSKQIDFIHVLILGGLNPRVFNILYAPSQRLSTESFFQKVHEKLESYVNGDNIRTFIFERELATRQSMAEPRVFVNPQAASFTEDNEDVDAALLDYMRMCHHRGRNLYIIALAFFLRHVPKEMSEPAEPKLRRFIDYMCALYTDHALGNSRALTADYMPVGARKRRHDGQANVIERRILLDRELGLGDSYAPVGYRMV